MSTKTLMENWKTLQRENDGDTNCNWRVRYSRLRIGTGSRGLGNKRMSGDYQNYSIIKISQNTEKSPWGDLLSLKLLWETIS